MKLTLSNAATTTVAIIAALKLANSVAEEEQCLNGVCTDDANTSSMNNSTYLGGNDNIEAPTPSILGDDDDKLHSQDNNAKKFSPHKCGLYLAPSLLRHGPGVFTAIDIDHGDIVGEPDMFLAILDRYKTVPYRGQHRYMSWLDYVRGITEYKIPKNIPLGELEDTMVRRSASGPQFWYDFYRYDGIFPGLGSEVNVHPSMANIQLKDDSYRHDTSGLHRNKDAGVGAFTNHYNVEFVATRPIEAGSELFLMPTEEEYDEYWKGKKEPNIDHNVAVRWLETHGRCIDNLYSKPSELSNGAGRGAFAKRSLKKDELIAPSAVAILKREVLQMYESNDHAQTFSQVLNKHNVEGTELVLNYCFGHPQSDILLLPVSPIVNYMNHYNDGSGKKKEPNVKIVWPDNTKLMDDPYFSWLEKHPTELLDLSGMVHIHYVALRDIAEDEELVLDYGTEWQSAWEKHVKEYSTSDEKEEEYTTALQYLSDDKFVIQTLEEEQRDGKKNPSNFQTICHFARKSRKTGTKKKCWLPCDVIDRDVHEVTGEVIFGATFDTSKHKRDGYMMDSWRNCVTSKRKKQTWTQYGLTAENITLIDKWDSIDQLQQQEQTNGGAKKNKVFRHAIGVPDGFFPDLWIKESAEYAITPMDDPRQLKPGEYRHITWKHNSQPITRNAYLIGLPEGFNDSMRKFAERQGAMQMFRSVLNGRPNKNGRHRYVDFQDGEWYVQRPHWNSNMHWIIPNSETARQAYLRQLGDAGFDIILKSIGTGMGMEKLTCFHNTLLGISQADDSNMHADFYETQRRSFDFLTPIIMADNSTDPEFHLQSRDGNIIVNIKYQYGTAVVMGDWTYHKSAPVDYYSQEEGDIRVVCSIYCSEITPENRDSLLKMYNEEHPAPFHHLFDIPVQEWHWDPDGTTLPRKASVQEQY